MVIGSTRGLDPSGHEPNRIAESKISSANPCQLVLPAPAKLKILPGDRDQRRSNIGGRSRTTLLIGDDAQNGPLNPQPQHCLDEICAMRAVHPGGPQDDVMWDSRPHRALTGFLAAPIDAERVDRILLPVGFELASVEDVIRRQVNERRRALAARRRDMSSSRAIDRPSQLGLAFSAVDCGIGRKVDHQIGALPCDHGADG